MFKKLLVNLLFRGVRIHSLRVKRLRVGNTIEITDDYIDMQPLTSDPPLAEGRMWYRSDQNLIKYSDGSTVKELRGVPVVISPTAGWGGAGKGSVWTVSGSDWEAHDMSWRDVEVDMGIGSAVLAFYEKLDVDNQSHGFALENLTDAVRVVEHSSTTELAGEHWHTINFTPPTGIKRYRFILHSDGSNYYTAGKHSIISSTPLKDLYLVELSEITQKYLVDGREVEQDIHIPAPRERLSLTYGIHAYNLKKGVAIIQIMDRVDPAKLDIIRPVSYRELKEFQRKWKYL